MGGFQILSPWKRMHKLLLAVSILTLEFDVMIASKAEYMGYAPYSQKRKHSSGMAIQKHRFA